MSAAWWQRERGAEWLLRLMGRIALHLGRPLARLLLPPICVYYLLSLRRARAPSRAYLQRVLGRPVRLRDIYRHYHAFASIILDRVYFATGRLDALEIRAHVAPDLAPVLASGRGCVLLSAHLGSFEALRGVGVHGQRRAINVLMHTDAAQRIQSILQSWVPGLGLRTVPMGRPETLLRVKECLDRGEIVGILADRVYSERRTAACQFLGDAARFPLGPLALAAVLGAPVLLGYGLYRGGPRYDIHLEALAPEGIGRDAQDPQLGEWAQRYASRLEHYCRQAPYNWFNFYDFWQQ